MERLKRRALAHGRSGEAEHRAIFEAALEPSLSGRELFELSREGETWPPGIEPDRWRQEDRGEPAISDVAGIVLDRNLVSEPSAWHSIPMWSHGTPASRLTACI